MGALLALGYVALTTVAILLISWLFGTLRAHKTRPHMGETPMDVALRRYEAGEIGDRELDLTRHRMGRAA